MNNINNYFIKSNSLGEEISFKNGYLVPSHIESMKVACRNELSEDLQSDIFAFVQPRRSIPPQKSWHRRPSVIMLGMDNLSRMTLRNNMPGLFKNIKKQGWFEMQGYTRLSQNSLPNLMALITGYSPDTWLNLQCKSDKLGCIDSLPLIWKRFRRKVYITAYGEGSSDISLFHMDKSGFVQKHLDFFASPFGKISINTDCVDRRLHIQFIHNYSEQFFKRHVNTKRSQFGFFWTNKVKQSNDEADKISEPLWLDHFVHMKKLNLFSQSIVIFFSDKGPSETQPMLLIWLPPWFRVHHPEIVQALRINGKRLTSAYDLHLTLHHILELGERWPRAVRKLLDCPSCQTLLAPVPENRTCADAGISEKLCPCDRFLLLKPKDYMKVPLGKLLVKSINEYLYHHNLHEICSKLKLKSTESVHLRDDTNSTSGSTFRVVFTASPNGPRFSATTRFSHKHKNLEYINVASINRLNSYRNDSDCLGKLMGKKFCICLNRIIKDVSKSKKKEKIKNPEILKNKKSTQINTTVNEEKKLNQTSKREPTFNIETISNINLEDAGQEVEADLYNIPDVDTFAAIDQKIEIISV